MKRKIIISIILSSFIGIASSSTYGVLFVGGEEINNSKGRAALDNQATKWKDDVSKKDSTVQFFPLDLGTSNSSRSVVGGLTRTFSNFSSVEITPRIMNGKDLGVLDERPWNLNIGSNNKQGTPTMQKKAPRPASLFNIGDFRYFDFQDFGTYDSNAISRLVFDNGIRLQGRSFTFSGGYLIEARYRDYAAFDDNIISDTSGVLIGSINRISSFINNNGDIIFNLLTGNRIADNLNNIIGSLHQVYLYKTNDSTQIPNAFVYRGTNQVRDFQGTIIGYIDINGDVYNLDNTLLTTRAELSARRGQGVGSYIDPNIATTIVVGNQGEVLYYGDGVSRRDLRYLNHIWLDSGGNYAVEKIDYRFDINDLSNQPLYHIEQNNNNVYEDRVLDNTYSKTNYTYPVHFPRNSSLPSIILDAVTDHIKYYINKDGLVFEYNFTNNKAFDTGTIVSGPKDKLGILFDFGTGVDGFGSWFGDLETRTDGNGIPAEIKLFDVNEQLIDTTTIEPIEGVSLVGKGYSQSFCGGSKGIHFCGNNTTRFIGFDTTSGAKARYMLVINGNNSNNTNTHGFSFIGGYLASNNTGSLYSGETPDTFYIGGEERNISSGRIELDKQADEWRNFIRGNIGSQSQFYGLYVGEGDNTFQFTGGFMRDLGGKINLNITPRIMDNSSPFGIEDERPWMFSIGNINAGGHPTMQKKAPRPASLFNTGPTRNYVYQDLGNYPDGSGRLGLLFDFGGPIKGFGTWFGDMETKSNGNGIPAEIKLFDENGVLLTGRNIPPKQGVTTSTGSEDDCLPTVAHSYCGNNTTRFIGFNLFSGSTSGARYMLVINGDDTISTIPHGFSFMGGYLATQNTGIEINSDSFYIGGEERNISSGRDALDEQAKNWKDSVTALEPTTKFDVLDLGNGDNTIQFTGGINKSIGDSGVNMIITPRIIDYSKLDLYPFGIEDDRPWMFNIGNINAEGHPTMQKKAPRPASLFGTKYPRNYVYQDLGNYPTGNNKLGLLFDFGSSVKGFGTWFGDMETKSNGDGISSEVKLFDENGNLIANKYIIPKQGITTSTGSENDCTYNNPHSYCGNNTTRFVGFNLFSGSNSGARYMLVINGDDTISNIPHGFSFMGGYLSNIGISNIEIKAKSSSYILSYNSSIGGSISGDLSQVVNENGTGTQVTASADIGYSFSGWSDGILTASRTDGGVSGNINVVAQFTINSYILSYNSSVGGSIIGNTYQNINYLGTGTQVTASANVGYSFSGWSDGVLTASRTDGGIVGNRTITAQFKLNTYSLSYGITSGGVISGSTNQIVSYGSNGSQVTAIPNTGYSFSGWSDGNKIINRVDSVIIANKHITAIFILNTYSLNYGTNSGGMISGNVNQIVSYGGNGSQVTAIPYTGYSFSGWSDGILTTSRTDGGIISNTSIVAQFKINTYLVQYNTSVGGIISGNSTQNIPYLGNGTSVTAVANSGYIFSGRSDGVISTTRLDLGINGSKTIYAYFKTVAVSKIPQGGGGSSLLLSLTPIELGNKIDGLIKTPELVKPIVKAPPTPITPIPEIPKPIEQVPTTDPDPTPVKIIEVNISSPQTVSESPIIETQNISIGQAIQLQTVLNPVLSTQEDCFEPSTSSIITLGSNTEYKDLLVYQGLIHSYGLTQYTNTDLYRPVDGLKRNEAAKMFVNFAKHVLCRKAKDTYKNQYTDIENTDQSLVPYIKSAYELGIMKGANGKFRPLDTISQQEFITSIVRMFINKYLENSSNSTDWFINYEKAFKNYGLDTLLGLDNNINRYDMSKIMYKLYYNEDYMYTDLGYVLPYK